MSQTPFTRRASLITEKPASAAPKDSSKILNVNDLLEDFNNNCRLHLGTKENLIFACYTCRKLLCTRCYCKNHRECYCNLVDLMYDDAKIECESNLKILLEMKDEFSSQLDLMERKSDYFNKINPFDVNENLINKIYDDIVNNINDNRKKSLANMSKLKESYENNISLNIEKVKDVINKCNDTEKGLNKEIQSMSTLKPLEFCKEYVIENRTDALIDSCEEIKVFSEQDFTRIKESFIDTNTIIFNDANIVVDQCKNFREYLSDKVSNFYTNYKKYEKKYAFTVVMSRKEFIVYLIENNQVNVVNYKNDFLIPSYARWIEISGNKLILTGGEKDYIESLNSTYMFKFSNYEDYDQESFQAKVYQKADMLYKRRAHNLIYLNDYIYAISGVDKLEMIKKCEKYDIYNDKWIETPGLNYPRQNAALACHNQRYLYAFAGYDGFNNVDSFESLDSQNESKGWTLYDFKNSAKDGENLDIKKNRMGVIPLDFDTILIFGGERNSKEYRNAYIYEFFENKFYKFNDLEKNSNFIMNPIYYAGKYILFDFKNNIHEFNLDTLMFEHKVFNRDEELKNL